MDDLRREDRSLAANRLVGLVDRVEDPGLAVGAGDRAGMAPRADARRDNRSDVRRLVAAVESVAEHEGDLAVLPRPRDRIEVRVAGVVLEEGHVLPRVAAPRIDVQPVTGG